MFEIMCEFTGMQSLTKLYNMTDSGVTDDSKV